MDSPIKQFEKNTNFKLKEMDGRIKTSFVLIRQDLDEMQSTISAMRKYLKKKDSEFNSNKKTDEKIREEFRKDVDEFTEKIRQLKSGLDSVKKLKREVVVRKDLAKIEERIKILFKNDLEDYKAENKKLKSNQDKLEKRIKMLEKGIVKGKKMSRFKALTESMSVDKIPEDNEKEEMELSKIKDAMFNKKKI